MTLPKNLTEIEKYEIYLKKLQVKEAYTAEEFALLIGKGKDFVEELEDKRIIKFKMMGGTKKYPKFEMQRYLHSNLMVAR